MSYEYACVLTFSVTSSASDLMIMDFEQVLSFQINPVFVVLSEFNLAQFYMAQT